MAGGADVIPIPEIPFDIDRVAEKIIERDRSGRRFSIVVIAEGAAPSGGEASYADAKGRYGGIAERIAPQVETKTGKERGPWCSATFSVGEHPSPTIGTWLSDSVRRRSAVFTMEIWGRWWHCMARQSYRCRWAMPSGISNGCLWTAITSPPHGNSESPWATENPAQW